MWLSSIACVLCVRLGFDPNQKEKYHGIDLVSCFDRQLAYFLLSKCYFGSFYCMPIPVLDTLRILDVRCKAPHAIIQPQKNRSGAGVATGQA